MKHFLSFLLFTFLISLSGLAGCGSNKSLSRSASFNDKDSQCAVFAIVYDSGEGQVFKGTGFFISPDGQAYTTVDVMGGHGAYKIQTCDSQFYDIEKVLAYNENSGISKIQVAQAEKDSFPNLSLADHAPYEADDAFAIGIHPDSLDYLFYEGIVSTIRLFKGYGLGILTSIPVFEDLHGAPMLNENGRVVGIFSVTLAEKFELNFAFSLENFDRLIPLDSNLTVLASGEQPTREELLDMYGPYYDSLVAMEKRLHPLSDSILDSWNEFGRMDALTDFIPVFKDALEIPGSYNYPFDSLGFMKVLQAEDNSFRMYNWILRFDNERFRYYGAIQFNNPDSLEFVPLFDGKKRIEFGIEEDTILGNESWYGVQYYDMAGIKIKKKKYYLLLGWDGNTDVSDRKVIDVLSFDEERMPVFGAPIFYVGDDVKMRKLFEYNDDAIMALQFELDKDAIIFDHLVPKDKKDKNRRWLYVPDGTYDYFEIKRNKLVYKERFYKGARNADRHADK